MNVPERKWGPCTKCEVQSSCHHFSLGRRHRDEANACTVLYPCVEAYADRLGWVLIYWGVGEKFLSDASHTVHAEMQEIVSLSSFSFT